MVNIEDFIKRLEVILDYYSLNASAFADKIGVQRSSLSHLLSGRNKPSLDFILKILEVFPEVDLYWILNGKGSFPKRSMENVTDSETLKNSSTPAPSFKNEDLTNLFSEIDRPVNTIPLNEKNNLANENNPSSEVTSTEIDKIVIFYKNGTFKDYKPAK
jgi:transcriptional regulator with XRE-family HTH domain